MDVCRLYTNTINIPFYVRDLSILVFWWLWWSRHCDPEDSKGWQYLLWHLTHHRERKQWICSQSLRIAPNPESVYLCF